MLSQRLIVSSLAALACAGTLGAHAVLAQAPQPVYSDAAPSDVATFRPVASNLVRATAVAPGQTVVIRGNSRLLPYMEVLAMEVEKMGATAVPIVTTDSLEKFRSHDAPAAYYSATASPAFQQLLQSADLWFAFPPSWGPGAGTPAERQALMAQRTQSYAPAAAKRRTVLVAIPVGLDTAPTGLTRAAYTKMLWDGMTADYGAIATKANALQARLASAHTIHVTSPNGTDVTFAVGPSSTTAAVGPAAQRSGGTVAYATMPGGSVLMQPVTGSATGKLRAPADMCDQPVHAEAIDIVAGRATNVHAGSDEACVKRSVEGSSLTLVTIGVNPAEPAVAKPGGMFMDQWAAGLVQFNFGNATFAGGPAAKEPPWGVGLGDATVTADGHVVVNAGKVVDNP